MELDGIITFVSTYHALSAEKAVKAEGIAARLVPAPRDLSATCVTALRFPWAEEARVKQLLSARGVEFDLACRYPEQQNRPPGWSLLR